MTNQATIADLGKAKAAALRSSLTLLVQGHQAEDLVAILSEVIDDEGLALARRTGDYSRAADLAVIARYLSRLDQHLENYDPTTEQQTMTDFQRKAFEFYNRWCDAHPPIASTRPQDAFLLAIGYLVNMTDGRPHADGAALLRELVVAYSRSKETI